MIFDVVQEDSFAVQIFKKHGFLQNSNTVASTFTSPMEIGSTSVIPLIDRHRDRAAIAVGATTALLLIFVFSAGA